MSSAVRVKAVYNHLDCMLTGVDRLKRAGYTGFTVQAPLPRHEIEEIMYEGRPSPVRWWTMTGAIIGLSAGWGITSRVSQDQANDAEPMGCLETLVINANNVATRSQQQQHLSLWRKGTSFI